MNSDCERMKGQIADLVTGILSDRQVQEVLVSAASPVVVVIAEAVGVAKVLDADRAALANAESSMSQTKQSSSASGVSSYSVVRGDNLWDISGKDNVYGDSYQWPLIYKTNRSKIKDADLIYPGQVFDIDQNASAADIDAAINHAKTRGAWSVGDVEQSDSDYLAR